MSCRRPQGAGVAACWRGRLKAPQGVSQVGDVLPDASDALAFARQLMTRFGGGAATGADFALNDIVAL
jgi:hypothetical protein